MAKRYRFTVEGKLPFPLDMLRYDACYPIDSESASMISASIRRNDSPTTYKVELMMAIAGNRPTDARWRSFSWTVTDTRQV